MRYNCILSVFLRVTLSKQSNRISIINRPIISANPDFLSEMPILPQMRIKNHKTSTNLHHQLAQLLLPQKCPQFQKKNCKDRSEEFHLGSQCEEVKLCGFCIVGCYFADSDNGIILPQQILSITLKMYNNYDDLLGCQLQSIYNLDTVDLHGKHTPKQEKILQPTPTQNNLGQFRALSIKKITRRLEISFQQHFMKEHAAVFSNSYQNYVEFQSRSKIIILNQADPHTETHIKNASLADILAHTHCPLSQAAKNQFTKDLLHQQKLSQFLQYIMDNTNRFDSFWLVLAVREIWTLYVPHQRNNYETNEILDLAAVISREPLVEYLKQILDKYWKLQVDFLSVFCDFLEIFAATVLLIVNEYFENPYYVEQNGMESPKRECNYYLFGDNQQLGDEAEEIALQAEPSKKRKKSL